MSSRRQYNMPPTEDTREALLEDTAPSTRLLPWAALACLGAANVIIFCQPTLTACVFSLVSAFLCVLFDGLLKAACAPLGMPVGTVPFCLAALTLLMTHGKIPGLHPIPLAEVATPEDHLIGDAAEMHLLKDA